MPKHHKANRCSKKIPAKERRGRECVAGKRLTDKGGCAEETKVGQGRVVYSPMTNGGTVVVVAVVLVMLVVPHSWHPLS